MHFKKKNGNGFWMSPQFAQVGGKSLILMYLKGDAKKMIQTLLTVGAFRLKNSHFYLICQKIDTLSFLMSYCRYL